MSMSGQATSSTSITTLTRTNHDNQQLDDNPCVADDKQLDDDPCGADKSTGDYPHIPNRLPPLILSLNELQVSISDAVHQHLSSCYRGLYSCPDEESQDQLGHKSSEQRLDCILQAMKTSPRISTIRLNACCAAENETIHLRCTRDNCIQEVKEILTKQWIEKDTDYNVSGGLHLDITPDKLLDDVILIRVVDTTYSLEHSCETSDSWSLASCRVPTLPASKYPTIYSHWPSRERHGWPVTHKVIICDRFCGEAVLRGSDIFVKGVMAADSGITAGDAVAVYADLPGVTARQKPGSDNHSLEPRQSKRRRDGKGGDEGMSNSNDLSPAIPPLPRGMQVEHYHGRACVFLGLGIAQCTRAEMFRLERGVAVRMSMKSLERVGPVLPPLNLVLEQSSAVFVQNLPSLVVGHALDPQQGDTILDMCAAPGGKTSHVASLVRNRAIIVACDRSRKKMVSAKELFDRLGCTCITPLHLDTTKCVDDPDIDGTGSRKSVQEILSTAIPSEKDGLLDVKMFSPQSFDRIVLDPPCSALGLRPKLQVDPGLTVETLLAFAKYQRKLVRAAVKLLKPGGVMTYSTCTIHAEENEIMVKHILDEYPEMDLVPIHIDIGKNGLPGLGLSATQCGFVKRFDPADQADTMGFFLAKFRKRNI